MTSPTDHRRRMRRIVEFLFVGGVGFLIDAAVFNILVHWNGEGILFAFPLEAKVIAILTATAGTYLGNRYLTYRDRRQRASFRQVLVFVSLNVVAILLQLACLGFSRYVLGLVDPVADNVSGTVIGQAVATVFRYYAYGRWVFPAAEAAPAQDDAGVTS